eukprot:5675218-Pyramimonas_sp.AAC.1
MVAHVGPRATSGRRRQVTRGTRAARSRGRETRARVAAQVGQQVKRHEERHAPRVHATEN